MKKLTKANIETLRREMPVLNETETRVIIAGSGSANGDYSSYIFGDPIYSWDEYTRLFASGSWGGGFVDCGDGIVNYILSPAVVTGSGNSCGHHDPWDGCGHYNPSDDSDCGDYNGICECGDCSDNYDEGGGEGATPNNTNNEKDPIIPTDCVFQSTMYVLNSLGCVCTVDDIKYEYVKFLMKDKKWTEEEASQFVEEWGVQNKEHVLEICYVLFDGGKIERDYVEQMISSEEYNGYVLGFINSNKGSGHAVVFNENIYNKEGELIGYKFYDHQNNTTGEVLLENVDLAFYAESYNDNICF